MSFLERIVTGQHLAVLIDPDKHEDNASLHPVLDKIKILQPSFIFVGGSTVHPEKFQSVCQYIKKHCSSEVIIFPGAYNQVDESADGILFLSLLSGRNPDFLIGHQIQAAPMLKKMEIEVIPTAYLLVDGGKSTSVAYVSQTTPIPSDQHSIAVDTTIAAELLGFKTVFLDAGSGAKHHVPTEMIKKIKLSTNLPVIVGGGVKSIDELENIYDSGANLVVIGNKIEEDVDFLLDLANYFHKKTVSNSASLT